MNIIFKEIIIINKISHKAKIQTFTNGINIITSDMQDGNYVGKSTLLKSLYHALGADLDFDSSKGWEKDSKYYYVLTFLKDTDQFTVVRKDRSFTFYDKNKKIVFSTQNRDELKLFYCDFFKMNVMLKKTDNEYKYETAKPFALFCLSYIGQKHYQGCSFSSFNSMSEYSDIREDIILSHLGVNDSEMNELEEKNNEYATLKNSKVQSSDILANMIEKINKNDEINYSVESIEAIKIQLELHENKYRKVIEEIQNLKVKLYELKNTKALILKYINEISKKMKTKNKNDGILSKHMCPLCENEISNYNEIFFKKVHVDDSLPIQLVDANAELAELERQIALKLQNYEEKVKELEKLEDILTQNNKSIESAIASLGLKKYKDSLVLELGAVQAEIVSIENKIIENNDRIKVLSKRITEINKSYENKLLSMKQKYGITIFDVPNNAKIRNTIKCSDEHVFTTLWICVLNQLKREFNSEGTFFPLVFDNPTDRDFDPHNTEAVLKMIFDEKNEVNQIIVSKLKFDSNEFQGYEINNQINLVNAQYHLLNDEDYALAMEKLINIIS